MGSFTFAQASLIQLEFKEKSPEIFHFVSEAKNLTQNENDSVYPQISSSANNLFVVWEESVGNYGKNYDVFFRKSNDGGNTFGSPINLSNNPGFSEHPQIASVGDIIYVAWVDDSSGKREIMFRESTDGGKTFTNSIPVSQNSMGPYHVELAAEGKNVYIVWNSFDVDASNMVLLSKSDDAGKTFGELREIGTADTETYPKIAAYGNEYYVAWNKKNNKDTEILFIKSDNDDKNTTYIPNIRRLNNEDIDGGESQVAATGDHVSVSWTNNLPIDEKHVYIRNSINNGNDFANTIHLPSKNSSNVEIIINNGIRYVVWQDNINGNQDIFLEESNINGTGLNKAINLSNNLGISECPSITVSSNGIHMVWEDDTTGNHEVLYKRLY